MFNFWVERACSKNSKNWLIQSVESSLQVRKLQISISERCTRGWLAASRSATWSFETLTERHNWLQMTRVCWVCLGGGSLVFSSSSHRSQPNPVARSTEHSRPREKWRGRSCPSWSIWRSHSRCTRSTRLSRSGTPSSNRQATFWGECCRVLVTHRWTCLFCGLFC